MRIVQFMASKKYVGAERSFVELCNELSKQDEVIALVVRGCEFKDRFSDRVRVIELKSNPSRYNPFLYFELKKLLKRLSPDVIHVHSAKAAEIMYRLNPSIPYVATKRNSKKNSIFQKIPNVVGVSKKAVEDIERAKIIYNGIVPVNVSDVKKEEKFTIIAIGALRNVKGFDILIEAVANFTFDFQLWIVGEGEERKRLEDLIKKRHLSKKVFLLGYREDTAVLQKKAHLQVINSHSEGFSRVLIEGLFYSDCIISTPVAGSVEVLNEAFLFPHGEVGKKIVDVYENYDRYVKDFEAIKQKRDFFTLSRVADEYRALYKKVARV